MIPKTLNLGAQYKILTRFQNGKKNRTEPNYYLTCQE